jgi:tRNA 5-methylaminomethyl-2-thiouridine biosynthesis bifunctional protein
MKQNHARLVWSEGVPLSESFGDFYCSLADGVAESCYVFIDGNKLSERCKDEFTGGLTIAETGFGTGSNLLCTLDTLSQLDNSPLYGVHFISTELYPLTLNDLKTALADHPKFQHYAKQLLEQYPPYIQGMHRFIFDKGRFYLTLCIGDAASSLRRIDSVIDAWYLDGFSPAKNPAMWSQELFSQVARLTKDKGTLATYAAASFVRKGLIEEGFKIDRRPGFGKKREMLTGKFTQPKAATAPTKRPWFALPKTKKPRTAIIIGAGLAGCTTAEALARKGVKVQLIDRGDDICQEASGNRQGALYAKLPTKPTLGGELHLCGLEYTLRLLGTYQCLDNQIASQCGVLQLAMSEKEAAKQNAIAASGDYSMDVVSIKSATEASKIAGTPIAHQALYFARAGWVQPKAFCKKLIAHPNVQLTLSTSITSLIQTADQSWSVFDQNNQQHTADIVIVASAAHAKEFEQLKHLPIKKIRGQVSVSKIDSSQDELRTVICGEGYISPPLNNLYTFGATFDLHDQSPELREADHNSNFSMITNAASAFASHLPPTDKWHGRVGYRCSTPDYLPIAGPAPVASAYIEQYAKLRDDKNWKFKNAPPELYRGLYLNVGHGSKGLITAPLIAEYLASNICSEPLPIPREISETLHPARFIIKSLIKGKK